MDVSQKKRPSDFMLTVVLPAHNEQGNVVVVTEEIFRHLSDLPKVEVIWVDDGSKDNTLSVIKQLAARDQRVRYVSLSRNFGHQMALKAGLDHARGDCVVTLDADGEHPPALIPQMLQLWLDGFDIVFTKRLVSDSLPWHKRYLSQVFYAVMHHLSTVHIEHGAADFRLLDRKVVEVCKQFGEKDLFWRGVVAWLGFHQAYFTYDQRTRVWGKTKYSLRKMVSFSLTGLTSFSTKPLYLGVFMGSVFASLAFCYAAYAVIIKVFTDESVSGWASLLASIMFVSGIQLVLMGIIGIYVGKIFEEVKGRPQYVIRASNCQKENAVPEGVIANVS